MQKYIEHYVKPYVDIWLMEKNAIAEDTAALKLEYEKRLKAFRYAKMITGWKKRARIKEIENLGLQYDYDKVFARSALTACHSGDLSKIEYAYGRPSTWELFLQADGLFVAIDGQHPAVLEYILNTGVDYRQANHLGVKAYELIFGLITDSDAVKRMQHVMLIRILQDLKIEATPANLEINMEKAIVNSVAIMVPHDWQQYSAQLKVRWQEKIAKHEAWWQKFVKEENESIYSDFELPELELRLQPINLKKTYDDTLVLITDHHNKIARQQDQALRAHQEAMQRVQREIEEDEAEGLIISFFTTLGSIITAFGAYPGFATAMEAAFVPLPTANASAVAIAAATKTAAAGTVIATSATVGFTSALISRSNPLTGTIYSAVFATFGAGVTNILEATKIAGNLNIAIKSIATASLSTVVYGGKHLTNISAALAANFTAEALFPSAASTAITDGVALTSAQASQRLGETIGRSFTAAVVATAIASEDLGQAILAASISSIQGGIETVGQTTRHNDSVAALNAVNSVAPVEIRMIPREDYPLRDNTIVFSGPQEERASSLVLAAGEHRREGDNFGVLNSRQGTTPDPQSEIRRSVDEFMARPENRYTGSLNYESRTPEQFQRNYGTKPTLPKVMWLYATNQLLPGDRKFVGNSISGSITEAVNRGEDQSWGRIRYAKRDADNLFVAMDRVYGQLAAEGLVPPIFARMAHTNIALSRAALSLVPETPGQFAMDVGIFVGAEPLAVSTMWMYRGVRNGFRLPITYASKQIVGGPLTWQQAARQTYEIADSTFAPGSIGAAKVWGTKARLKAAKLPVEGKIRFVPIKGYHASNPIRKGTNGGYIDRFGNEWVSGPSRTAGQAFEWDVQLSDLGRHKLGWASRDGKHINVSLDGRLTHR